MRLDGWDIDGNGADDGQTAEHPDGGPKDHHKVAERSWRVGAVPKEVADVGWKAR